MLTTMRHCRSSPCGIAAHQNAALPLMSFAVIYMRHCRLCGWMDEANGVPTFKYQYRCGIAAHYDAALPLTKMQHCRPCLLLSSTCGIAACVGGWMKRMGSLHLYCIPKHRDIEAPRHRDTEEPRRRGTETQRHRETETQRHRDTETQRVVGKAVVFSAVDTTKRYLRTRAAYSEIVQRCGSFCPKRLLRGM